MNTWDYLLWGHIILIYEAHGFNFHFLSLDIATTQTNKARQLSHYLSMYPLNGSPWPLSEKLLPMANFSDAAPGIAHLSNLLANV